jgi:vancomycin resistance protein YoaR
VAFGAGVIVALLVALTVVERLVYRDRVLPGVEVGGTSVSGDDEREAAERLDAAAREIENEPVRATADDQELTFDRSAIEYQLDVDGSVRAARKTGRSRNPLDQLGGLLLRRVRPDEIEWEASWNEARLSEELDAWSEELSQGLENGGLTFEGANVIEVAPKPGIGLQRDEALADIEAMLRDGKDRVIELDVGPTDPPVDDAEVARAAAKARELLSQPITLIVDATPVTITPEQVGFAMTATPRRGELRLGLDPARLRFALGGTLAPFEVAPADASFAVSDPTVTINPATNGQTVDMERVARAILRGKRTVTGRKIEQPAGFTTEMAQALNITEKVSEFTTFYTAGQPRVLNIQKGCGIINGVLVRPGETFSLNDTLGPRTLELGWVNAPAFATGGGSSRRPEGA